MRFLNIGEFHNKNTENDNDSNNDTVIDPQNILVRLVKAADNFSLFQKKIDKRGRKLIDFDAERHAVQQMQNNPNRNEAKFVRAKVTCLYLSFVENAVNIIRMRFLVQYQTPNVNKKQFHY